jgi:nicotinate dehydrogenase subunit B
LLASPQETRKSAKRRGWVLGGLGGIAASILAGGLLTASPWRGAYPEIVRPAADAFSAATIEKGRMAAAVGACNVCHVGEDGTPFAGGRPFETPFGTVYATNISPDEKHGIGAWSYPAFERAMRQGVSRDGHHLYPVHPYPSFAGVEEADAQAIYAYLMAQEAVARSGTRTSLRFPFGIRPLMAGWNMLFAGGRTVPATPSTDAETTRGRYLVETLGHCSACHSPRNSFGAEMSGADHLAGGFADGWHAPALNGQGPAPVAWTQQALFDYLRHGAAADHGSAGGPMAAVVRSMEALPDSDIKAMSTYLATLSPTSPDQAAAQRTAALAASDIAAANAARLSPRGARMFESACTACHNERSALSVLSLNTGIHAETPDNVIQAILDGMDAPALLSKQSSEVMSMPSYRGSLNDDQIADLAAYLRARFAPDKPAWPTLSQSAATTRAATATQGASW